MVAAGGTPVAVAVATAAVTAAGTTVVVAGAETGRAIVSATVNGGDRQCHGKEQEDEVGRWRHC